jgi:hypothetical protein
MTLEQRIKALEQAVKVLVGGEFTVANGQLFIQKAFIQDGAIKAADVETAGRMQLSEKGLMLNNESGVTSCRLSLP